ncbi:MAG: dienelactone hydrolase family protein, partial [Pseudomonadota bacterium]
MNVLTNRIEYSVGDVVHQGYLAFDDEITESRPGILILHEWWGLNEYIVRRAHMLAELGYVVLALDMYGAGKIAANPDEAGSLMTSAREDMEHTTAALKTGYELLLSQPGVDSDKTAAIGYCFGGGMVLHMARTGMPLSAVVSFHGSLGALHTAEPGSIQSKILVCHGEADSMVTMDDVDGLKHEMNSAAADFEILLLPQAKHSFSNPAADDNAQKYGLDLGYQQEADELSWSAMK